MEEAMASPILPSIDRVLRLFNSMGREQKMQALVRFSKKLEPFPERFRTWTGRSSYPGRDSVTWNLRHSLSPPNSLTSPKLTQA
jgi:sulfur transfer protein SufE